MYILPNFKARKRDGNPDDEGLRQLREILTKRVEGSLFTEKALDALAKFSGGIPRELIAVARRACLEARKSQRLVIEEDAVERALKSRRRDYQVLLTLEQLRNLAWITQTKRVENDEAHRSLLHNLSALEYRNDDIWYDVHPVIEPLLSGDN